MIHNGNNMDKTTKNSKQPSAKRIKNSDVSSNNTATEKENQALTKKQRRIISDEKILNAALNEFAEKGYSKASLVNIAINANVSVGLIAQNFGCKELLFESVYKRNHQMLNLPYKGKKTDDWQDRINDIVSRYEKDLQKPSFLNELKFICIALDGKDIPESTNEYFESEFSRSELYSALQKGQKKGSLIKGDVTAIYKVVYKTICNTLYDCKSAGLAFPDKTWFTAMITKKSTRIKQ